MSRSLPFEVASAPAKREFHCQRLTAHLGVWLPEDGPERLEFFGACIVADVIMNHVRKMLLIFGRNNPIIFMLS